MKRTLIATVVAAAAAGAGPAFAMDEPLIVLGERHFAAADAVREQADVWKRWADDFSREMRASMGTMFAPQMSAGKLVKGAPYSAEIVTETNQTLADGNVISRKQSARFYRDSEGRTRQETGGDGNERNVFINDPVSGKHYVLVPGSKRAIATPAAAPRPMAFTHDERHKQVVRIGDTELRVEGGKVFVDGREMTGRVERTSPSGKKVVVENGRITIDGKEIGHGPGDGTNIVVNTVESPDGVRREEVRVHVVRTGEGHEIPAPPVPPRAPRAPAPPMPGMAPEALHAPHAPLPPMPGVNTLRFESTAKLGKGVTTQLGVKDIEGVKAEGKATVWTIPAGQIGNRNPIQITSEKWYSPELQATVHSRYNDPRTGETVYRLAGIRRAEPPAELFRVPEDYDMKSRGRK